MVPGFAVACKCADFGGGPENMRNLTFARFDENLKKTRKKRVFWTFKKRGTTMWWLPPNYLLFRYPVWPPNYVGGYSGTPPKRGGRVPDPSQPETGFRFRKRGFRVSANCAFLHRNGFRDFGVSRFTPSGHPHGMGSRGKLAGPNFRDSNIAK